jgi:hypothetical protein
MKPISMVFVLLAIAASGIWQGTPLAAEEKTDAIPRWEYRVLTKAQVIDVARKDLAAGLNKLGDEGWELVAVKEVYIFKRPSISQQVEKIRSRIALVESKVEMLKDRVAWSERMAKKGFLTSEQVKASREQLRQAEMALDGARKDLKSYLGDPKKPVKKETKPERK